MALGRTPLPTAHDRAAPPRCRVVGAAGRRLSNDRYARSYGKMTFPAATSRREKVRWDLFTGTSMTAQSR